MTDDLQLVTDYFDEVIDEKKEERTEAYLMRDYYDNKQLTDAELEVLRERRQPAVIDNLFKDKVQYLRGLEKRTRSDPKAYPRNPADEEASEAATDALRYIADRSNFDVVRSCASENLFIEGTGIGELTAKKGKDDEVNLGVRHLPWDRFILDPHAMSKDASDAKYMGQAIWMDLDDAIRKYPGAKRELTDLADTALREMDESYADKPIAKWMDPERKRVRVIEMYYLKAGIAYRCLFFRDKMLESPKESIYPKDDDEGTPWFPYRVMSAFIDRKGCRYGVGRRYKDPQDEINKRRSKALHLVNSRQIVMEKGAVDDVEQARQEGAKPDGVLEVNPGMRFEFANNQDLAQGQFALLQNSLSQMSSTSPNSSMMGSNTPVPSGRAQEVAQNAGSISETPIFDEIQEWQASVYRGLWKLVQKFWTEEKWVRVTDDEDNIKFGRLNYPITKGEQIVEKMKENGDFDRMGPEQAQQVIDRIASDPAMQEKVEIRNNVGNLNVDIVVQEGPDIVNIQAEQFEQLAQIAQFVQIPPDVIIQASQLRNKDKLIEMLKGGGDSPEAQAAAQEQKAQMQKMAEQQDAMFNLLMQQKQADVQKTVAEAQETEAKAIKTAREAGAV